jgi:hypothetical protein
MESGEGSRPAMGYLPATTWELALLALAVYVAVVSLVRLMLAERDRLGRELGQQISAEQARLAAEKRKAERDRRRKEIEEEYERLRRKTA